MGSNTHMGRKDGEKANTRTIFLVHLLNFEQIPALLHAVPVEFIPSRDGRNFGARHPCQRQRAEAQPVDSERRTTNGCEDDHSGYCASQWCRCVMVEHLWMMSLTLSTQGSRESSLQRTHSAWTKSRGAGGRD